MRIYEGDLKVMMTIIGKLSDKLVEHDKYYSAIGGELSAIH
jgi:hypothetical protein